MIPVDPQKEDDPFYRYQMPRIQVKYEGGGNGQKTVLVNLPEVANVLAREPKEIIRYLSKQLGASAVTKEEKYVLTGSADVATVQKALYSYIVSQVLCPKCRNPETVVVMKNLCCKACGTT